MIAWLPDLAQAHALLISISAHDPERFERASLALMDELPAPENGRWVYRYSRSTVPHELVWDLGDQSVDVWAGELYTGAEGTTIKGKHMDTLAGALEELVPARIRVGFAYPREEYTSPLIPRRRLWEKDLEVGDGTTLNYTPVGIRYEATGDDFPASFIVDRSGDSEMTLQIDLANSALGTEVMEAIWNWAQSLANLVVTEEVGDGESE